MLMLARLSLEEVMVDLPAETFEPVTSFLRMCTYRTRAQVGKNVKGPLLELR